MLIIRLEGKDDITMLDTMNNTKKKSLLATERGEPERSGGELNGVANKLASLAVYMLRENSYSIKGVFRIEGLSI